MSNYTADRKDTWEHCASVIVRFPWASTVQGDVYLWLLHTLGPLGTGWQMAIEGPEPLQVEFMFADVEFMFADAKYATLFALVWSDLIVDNTHI